MGSSRINFNPAPVSIYRLLALVSSIAFPRPISSVSLRICPRLVIKLLKVCVNNQRSNK